MHIRFYCRPPEGPDMKPRTLLLFLWLSGELYERSPHSTRLSPRAQDVLNEFHSWVHPRLWEDDDNLVSNAKTVNRAITPLTTNFNLSSLDDSIAITPAWLDAAVKNGSGNILQVNASTCFKNVLCGMQTFWIVYRALLNAFFSWCKVMLDRDNEWRPTRGTDLSHHFHALKNKIFIISAL